MVNECTTTQRPENVKLFVVQSSARRKGYNKLLMMYLIIVNNTIKRITTMFIFFIIRINAFIITNSSEFTWRSKVAGEGWV